MQVETLPETSSPDAQSKSHPAVLPQKEFASTFEAARYFAPAATAYVIRHLTVGAVIRVRRIILRRLGRTYYV